MAAIAEAGGGLNMPLIHSGGDGRGRLAKCRGCAFLARWPIVLVFVWMALAASVARSQDEEPAPEPYIPQSQFEQPQGESSLDQQLRTCNEALGYVGCDQLWHGGRGGGGAPGIWGALAMSRSSLIYGYAYDFPSQESAKAGALKKCNAALKGKRDCQAIFNFSNNCLALATSEEGIYGYSKAYRDLVADDKEALGYCQKAGGKSCTTVLAFCSPNAGFHIWVGLAISNEPPHSKVGIAWGAPAQSGASKLAMDSCIKDGGTKCQVRMLLYNQCIAFASSPNGMWSAAANISRKVAENNSLRGCQSKGGMSCSVTLSKCSQDK
jgi:Domain of unknown function (DUF4189)